MNLHESHNILRTNMTTNKEQQEAEREAFEASMIKVFGKGINLKRDSEWVDENTTTGLIYLSENVEFAWHGWQARAKLTSQVASGEAVANRQTPFANCQFQICDLPGQCKGAGRCHHPVTVEDVRNAPTPSPSNVLVEALTFCRNKMKSATMCHENAVQYLIEEGLERANQALATYSAPSTDSVSISTSEYEALKADAERYRWLSSNALPMLHFKVEWKGNLSDWTPDREKVVVEYFSWNNISEAIDTARKSS